MAYLDQDPVLGITTIITDAREIRNVVNVSAAGSIGRVGATFYGDGSGLTIPASSTALTNNRYQVLAVNPAGIATINVANGNVIGIALTGNINRLEFTNVPTVSELILHVTQNDGSVGYKINWTASVGVNSITNIGVGNTVVSWGPSVATTSTVPYIAFADYYFAPYHLFQDRNTIIRLKTTDGGLKWLGRVFVDFYDKFNPTGSSASGIGTVYSFGTAGVYGSLGLGNLVPRSSPTIVLSGTKWRQVSSGKDHFLAVRNDGTLWSCGRNFEGQLGLGSTVTPLAVSTPVQVGALSNWSYVSAGENFSVAVNNAGQVFAWGLNSSGQLADNTTINRSSPITIINNTGWRQVDAGREHCLGIRSDGSLWSWGSNLTGQLGLDSFANRSSPTRITGVGTGGGTVDPIGVGTYLDWNWKQVSAGTDHSAALTFNGELFTWGKNSNNQLGLEDAETRLTPCRVFSVRLMSNSGIPRAFGNPVNMWNKVWTGDYNTYALDNTGHLWGWGRGSEGQFGDGTTGNRSRPDLVGSAYFNPYYNETNVYNMGWRDFSIAKHDSYHCIGVKRDGSLWSWGYNAEGQLGLNDTINRSVPTRVGIGSDWIEVNAAYRQSFAITAS